MRQISELLNRSPPEHRTTSGSSCSWETTMPAPGFTAVNGLDREQPVSPSSMPGPTTDQSGLSQVAVTSDMARDDQRSTRRSGTRNDSVLCAEPSIKQSPETAKRKRSIAETIEQPSDEMTLSAILPSKRRMTAEHIAHSKTPEESGAALLSEDRATRNTLELSNRDRCSREISPVPTRNQRVAPPQVRPETQAHLAESLATHLQSTAAKEPEAPATTSQGDSPRKAYSPEEAGGDPTGKRKRNFSNRTKSGCHTCRQRKKKCDETKPECKNCTRGSHDCLGYGPKPLNYKGLPNTSRTNVPLQSKVVQDTPRPSSPPDEQDGGPRYDHWGRVPPAPGLQEHHHRLPSSRSPHDVRRSSRDIYSSQNWQHRPESSYVYGTMPPSIGHAHSMPPVALYANHGPYSPPPHEPWQHPFSQPYRSNPGPPMTISARESVSTHSSHGGPPHSYLGDNRITDRQNMMNGMPYRPYKGVELIVDRQKCKTAVERFNQADSHATSSEEKERLFAAILDPNQRSDAEYYENRPIIPPRTTAFNRPSRFGHRVVIDTPFRCDYGYNIEIGNDVVISANCYMQDPCEITIGHNVYIGANVHFCGNAVSRDSYKPKGTQGYYVGGSIIVEDDVDIGPGVIILPYRVIGTGSSVAAGSVVTKNVPPYTEVAGNPAKVIRDLPRPNELRIAHAGIDKDILEENERSLRELRIRRGVVEK